MEAILEQLGGIHLHCSTCYSFTRCSQEDDACDNIPCRLSCSQVFHACKEMEHIQYLCPNARIPCLNSTYGCGLEILRKDMPTHLSVCPASLIVCTAEWHRLPIYSSHRCIKGQPLNVNPVPKRGQLDYELALRDQAIVNEALKNKSLVVTTSSKPSKYINRKEKVEEGNDPQTLKQLEHWGQELKRRIKGIPPPMKYWEFPELEKGNVHSRHCSHCVLIDCPGDTEQFCPIIDCAWGCQYQFHACKSSEHNLICSYYVEPKDTDWIYRGMSRITDLKRIGAFRNSPEVQNRLPKKDNPTTRPMLSPLKDAQRKKGKMVKGNWIPDPPPMPPIPDFWNPSRFDIRYDFVSNKRDRQKDMHALRCHEELRRDQYMWHYQNIHSEIISELSCWIENRCPLYGYGCNFSVRRLYPEDRHNNNMTLTFNRYTGTFALKNEDYLAAKENHCSSLGLHLLPLEILSIIFSFLDPSSLYNLSVTCKYLRDVCQSFLDIHGCVTPQWEREKVEDRISWKISNFRWFYSNSFDPIKKWRIDNLGAVSNHLTECPYYQTLQHTGLDSLDQKSKDKWTAILAQMKARPRFNTIPAKNASNHYT